MPVRYTRLVATDNAPASCMQLLAKSNVFSFVKVVRLSLSHVAPESPMLFVQSRRAVRLDAVLGSSELSTTASRSPISFFSRSRSVTPLARTDLDHPKSAICSRPEHAQRASPMTSHSLSPSPLFLRSSLLSDAALLRRKRPAIAPISYPDRSRSSQPPAASREKAAHPLSTDKREQDDRPSNSAPQPASPTELLRRENCTRSAKQTTPTAREAAPTSEIRFSESESD
mmetsp:Transcript_34050/g.71490  ORF Transcript_34050/g.71490 Transcript_34050/m.71490 type:complete len:228 (-) Transcript_34050:334-1017(-)